MDPARVAARLIEAMTGLEPGPALDGVAARRLAALPADEAAMALAELARATPHDPGERKALTALCRAVAWGAPELPLEHRRAIRAAAHALGLGTVAALLTEATLDRAGDSGARRVDPEIGALTLGHRKMAARAETAQDRLARFACDAEPSVIHNLLLNPRLTEALVIRIAARRPAPPDVLVEVARSPRWSVRRAVRRALALNPDAPPSLVNPLLPLLPGPDLDEVAGSEGLHPAVRAAARAVRAGRRGAG